MYTIVKKVILMLMLMVLISFETFSAIVSDNDGSAFVTKAEFEALKTSFNKQIDDYNVSIDGKIDGAIASYLAGISLVSVTTLKNIQMDEVGNKIYFGKIYKRDPRVTYSMRYKVAGGFYDGGAPNNYKYFEVAERNAYIPTADVTYDSTTYTYANSSFGEKARYVAMSEVEKGLDTYQTYRGEYNKPYCDTFTIGSGGGTNNSVAESGGFPYLAYKNSKTVRLTRGVPSWTAIGPTCSSTYQSKDSNGTDMQTGNWIVFGKVQDYQKIGTSYDTRYPGMTLYSYANRIDTKKDGTITDYSSWQLDGGLTLSDTNKWRCLSNSWTSPSYDQQPIHLGNVNQAYSATVTIQAGTWGSSYAFPYCNLYCAYFAPGYKDIIEKNLYNYQITRNTKFPTPLYGGVPLTVADTKGTVEVTFGLKGSETSDGKIQVAFKIGSCFDNDTAFANAIEVEAFDSNVGGSKIGDGVKGTITTVPVKDTIVYKRFVIPVNSGDVIYYKLKYTNASGSAWTKIGDGATECAYCWVDYFSSISNQSET